MEVSSGRKAGRFLLMVGILCALIVGLAACGSSSSSSSSSTTESGSKEGSEEKETGAAIPPYNGPEKSLPTSYAEPKIISGENFVVGYLSPDAAVEGLIEEEEAIKKETEALGGKFISYDTQSNPEKQVAEFKTLLTQGVTAILMQPANPEALGPLIAEAKEKEIPVVTTNTPADAPTPNIPGYVSDVLQGVDQCAYLNAKGVAEKYPGTNFVELGTSLPYPSLEYTAERDVYWGKKLGLEFLGEEQTKTPVPTDGTTSMNAILTRYPEVESVFTWLDDIALGASSAARAQGNSVRILGSNGQKAAIEAVKSGTLYSTCKYDFAEMGKQATIAAYDAQTKQNLPLPEKIVATPELITQENAG